MFKLNTNKKAYMHILCWESPFRKAIKKFTQHQHVQIINWQIIAGIKLLEQ